MMKKKLFNRSVFVRINKRSSITAAFMEKPIIKYAMQHNDSLYEIYLSNIIPLDNCYLLPRQFILLDFSLFARSHFEDTHMDFPVKQPS